MISFQLFECEAESESLIIFCHGFQSNKTKGKFLLDLFLPEFSILLFDFNGCGNNSSEKFTYGLEESEQL